MVRLGSLGPPDDVGRQESLIQAMQLPTFRYRYLGMDATNKPDSMLDVRDVILIHRRAPRGFRFFRRTHDTRSVSE